MSDWRPDLQRRSAPVVQSLVALTPWALVLVYVIGNATPVGEPTDWGEVARVVAAGSVPLVLALATCAIHPGLRSLWRGWSGVLMSWTIAFFTFVAVAYQQGPFL